MKNRKMKIIICSAMTLIMLFLSAPFAFTAGSLFGTGTCPVPGITGHTQSLTFTILDGPAPAGSRITAVAGSCTVYGDFPDTLLSAGGRTAQVTSSSYYTEVFNGLSPMLPFTLRMTYPGEYGHPSGATPGTCNIWISWVEAAPVSTEITGPDSVEIDKNIQLDGTVANAWIYNWTTTGNCSLVGATDKATVTLKGVHGGSCTITRTACNGHNECATDTHEVVVIGPAWMIPMYHLLLLQ